MAKTLVVGSAGFVGSHLMKRLEADTCDLKDGQDFRELEPHPYDVIIFLAADLNFTYEAYKYNEELYQALARYYQFNPRVIFTSSGFVYGNNVGYPQDPYGKCKLLGEQYVKAFDSWTILRCSNIYGEGGHSAIDIFRKGGHIIHGDGLQLRDFVPVEIVVQKLVKAAYGDKNETINVSSGFSQNINEIFEIFGTGVPIYEPDTPHGLDVCVLKPGKVNED